MEYRKLISFGKSSFVVSLPKTWVVQNKLKKGDLIYFSDSAADLIIQAKPALEEIEKEIVINIDGKDLRRIHREIISAYIQNYKSIIISGSDLKTKAKEIQEFIQNLVAMEVLEQDSKKMVSKDFLNINDISLDQIIRKMDAITRSMLHDCTEMFKEDTSESIYYRDSDVNKFRFLVYRIIWYGMENPTLIFKKLKLKQRDLFNYWWLSYSLEAIADCVKRIARLLKGIKLSPAVKQEYTQILSEIEQMYQDIMKAYYTKNPELSYQILNHRFEILKKCEDFYHNTNNIPHIGDLVYNSKSLVVTITTIGRIVYGGMPG